LAVGAAHFESLIIAGEPDPAENEKYGSGRPPIGGRLKLIIQIPCYNEEGTLGITLGELPYKVEGFDEVEWLIIDDGSKDRTVEVARECGVDHIVRLPYNSGLARAFMEGIDASLAAGADVIVNTDADNQYQAQDIPKLTAPVLAGQADIVIGARPIESIEHFSPIKKLLQKLGSTVVRTISGADVVDAPSGFRAISRRTAIELQVFNRYTYTLETIIQAGATGMRVMSVPIRVNGDLRPSRLVKSIWSYVTRSLFTMVRIYLIYRPMKFLFGIGMLPVGLGLILMGRWLYLYLYEYQLTGRVHLPSLVVAAILLLGGLQIWLSGLMAELLAANRRILEDIRREARRARFGR
jgi:glycosyltransferase involved in cell wall biosynthesis